MDGVRRDRTKVSVKEVEMPAGNHEPAPRLMIGQCYDYDLDAPAGARTERWDFAGLQMFKSMMRVSLSLFCIFYFLTHIFSCLPRRPIRLLFVRQRIRCVQSELCDEHHPEVLPLCITGRLQCRKSSTFICSR